MSPLVQIQQRRLRRLVTLALFACFVAGSMLGFQWLLPWFTREPSPPGPGLHFKVNCAVNGSRSTEVTQCQVTNLCLSRRHGIFVIHPRPQEASFPSVMPLGIHEPSEEYYVIPKIVAPEELHVDDVVVHHRTHLVIAGTYDQYHLSHAIINSAVPLFAIISDEVAEREYPTKELLTVGKLIDSHHTAYGFPMENLGFSRLYASGLSHSYLWDWTLPNDPLPIQGTPEGSYSFEEKAHCYPHVTLGLGQVCAHCPNVPSRELLSSFRETILRSFDIVPQVREGRLLIVQRKGSRRIANLNEALAAFDQRNITYDVITLDKMALRDQIRWFAEATVVFAPHGNANVHVHWMRPGSVFIEAYNPSRYGGRFFIAAAEQLGLRTYQIFCHNGDCEHDESKNARDGAIYVAPKDIVSVLEEILFINKL